MHGNIQSGAEVETNRLYSICESNYVFGRYLSESSVLMISLVIEWCSVLPYRERELSSPPSHCLSPLPFRSLLISHWHRPLFSLWRCVRIQLVWVMLCCLVLFSNGHSGQESSWTRTHAQTHIHVTRGKSSQRLTIHSPHYHTACLSEGTESGGGGYVLLFYPRALSRRHGIAFTVARFHFHQTRKCHGSQGLSLNLQ